MSKSTTQQFLEIDQIREGILILKNKGLRSVLMVSSLNFALKSDEEQNIIISQFQNFLNSLDFSVQIIVQTRRLNITGYLDKLKKLEEKQKNELLKIQTTGYREFIESLLETGVIMSKSFFVIVPYTLPWTPKKSQVKQLFKSRKIPSFSEDDFQRAKSQLRQRKEFIILGLKRCGLKTVPLNTPEIIELFWSSHHLQRAEVGYYPEIPPEFTK